MTRLVLLAILLGGTSGASVAAAQGRDIPSDPAEAISSILRDGCAATERGDSKGAMAPFLPGKDLVEYDFGPPNSKNYAQHKAETEGLFRQLVGKPTCIYLSIDPRPLSADAWYSLARMRFVARLKDGRAIDITFRSTDIWRKVSGQWLIVHEHNSFPVDIFTGRADLHSGQ